MDLKDIRPVDLENMSTEELLALHDRLRRQRISTGRASAKKRAARKSADKKLIEKLAQLLESADA